MYKITPSSLFIGKMRIIFFLIFIINPFNAGRFCMCEKCQAIIIEEIVFYNLKKSDQKYIVGTWK